MAAKYPEDSERHLEHGALHLAGPSEIDGFVPECEVLFEGEGDNLNTLHKNCKKNPGHLSFIPVSEFRIDHLPKQLQTQENMDLIQQKVDKTVRIRVAYTSINRPDVFFDSKAGYPYADLKGRKRAVRYGTGSISRLLSSEPIKDRKCPCHICVKSGDPEKEYYLVSVRTATHVIYDDSEAELATFDCFFDSDDTTNFKTLYGLSIDGTGTSFASMYKSDVCEVVCATHDRGTMEMISTILQSSSSKLSLPHMFSTALPPEGVIVSHPHGCSKRITIGSVLSLTVPVKPSYETCSPIDLPSNTKCHIDQVLNSEKEMIELSSALQKKKNSTSSGIKIALSTNIEETAQRNVLDNNGRTSEPAVCEANNIRTINQTDAELEENLQSSTSNVFDEKKDAPPSDQMAVLNKFYDNIISAVPVASEFNYNSINSAAVIESIRSVLQDKSVPKEILLRRVAGAILNQLPNVTQTSKQNSGRENDVKEINISFRENTATLINDMMHAFGISDDLSGSILEAMSDSPLAAMLDSTQTHTLRQSSFEKYIGNLFQKAHQFLIDNDNENDRVTLDESSSSSEDEVDVDCAYEEAYHELIKQGMEDILNGYDARTRSALKSCGFEDLACQMGSMFIGAPVLKKHNDFEIPSSVQFILPPDAQYAMRYHPEKPGWFSFPPGTQIMNAADEMILLPEGVTFRNSTFHPQHCYIDYDIDTCPGSSGAAVYSNLLDNEYMTFFPHSGSAKTCNLSGLQENHMFSATSHTAQAMRSIIQKIVDIDLD